MKPILISLITAATLAADPAPQVTDAELVRFLLEQNLSDRTFDFPTIAHACSGKQVIPLDRQNPTHQLLLTHIETALAQTIREHNLESSPIRNLRRINEASRFFEDSLIEKLNAIDGLTCTPAPTVAGTQQRSGYPDIRLLHEPTSTVFYLDPKLIEAGSQNSTLRTFYFEPKTHTLKITDDATHLILAIEHDGNPGQWKFTGWRTSCLSKLTVRLKAEFQANNRDLYHDCTLSIPPDAP